ncbi:DUF6959 family protein [Streptomyces sp. NPDC001340]
MDDPRSWGPSPHPRGWSHVLTSFVGWLAGAAPRACGDGPQACERGDLAEVQDSAGLLLARLDAVLTRYANALQEHEIPRPY